ncbi:MAG: hypothetical protein QW614_00215 [Candidatus Caldarchaeum sp.]
MTNSEGHGKKLSQSSISPEDFAILMRVAETFRKGKPYTFFEVIQPFNEVRLSADLPANMSVQQLVERLDFLVHSNLLRSRFSRKLLRCPKCGGALLNPRTACTSCRSEDITKSLILMHSCGAVIPENVVKTLVVCPKCRDTLEKSSNTAGFRFVCNTCGNIFTEPLCLTECFSCGWFDELKNADQMILREYELTDQGLSLIESADPLKILIRKLVSDGFEIREKVEVTGLSGTKHLLDVVATSSEKSETRIYTVKYRVTSLDIVSWTVKRFDIEKTSIQGVVGRVRWFIAGVEVENAAFKTGETFGIEVEKI